MKKLELRKIIKEEIINLLEKEVHPGEAFYNENYKDIIKVFNKYPENKWFKEPTYSKINKIVNNFTKVILGEYGRKYPEEWQYSSAWEFFANDVIPGYKKPTFNNFFNH